MTKKYGFGQRALQRIMDDRGLDYRRLGGFNRPKKVAVKGREMYQLMFSYTTPSASGGVWGDSHQDVIFTVDRETLIAAIENPLGCNYEPKKSITYV